MKFFSIDVALPFLEWSFGAKRSGTTGSVLLSQHEGLMFREKLFASTFVEGEMNQCFAVQHDLLIVAIPLSPQYA